MWWTRGKNKHLSFLTCHLIPHFAPIPHSRENKKFANRTREQNAQRPRPLVCAGWRGKVRPPPSAPPSAPLTREQDARVESARAPPPRLRRRRGKVRPPPAAPLTRQQDAQTERAAPPLSPAALDCAQKGAQRFPLPDCPQPPLTREPDAPTNTQGPHPPLVPPCLPRAQGVAPPFARRPFTRKRGV